MSGALNIKSERPVSQSQLSQLISCVTLGHHFHLISYVTTEPQFPLNEKNNALSTKVFLGYITLVWRRSHMGDMPVKHMV